MFQKILQNCSKSIPDTKNTQNNTKRVPKSVIKVLPKCVPKSLKYVITPNTEAIFWRGNLKYVITPVTLRWQIFPEKSETRNYSGSENFFWPNSPIMQIRNYKLTKKTKPSTCLASGVLHASLNFLREKK